MSSRTALGLALGALGLLAGGAWLGRAATTTSSSAPTQVAPTSPPQPTLAPAPPLVRSARTPMPAMPATRQPPSTAAAPGLAADLRDPDPKIRRAAVLEAARDPDVDPQLLLAASRDADREVGVIATGALGKLHADGAVSTRDLIARATDHGLDERVRVTALDGLGQVADREAGKLLVDLLAHGDVTERRSAAILLVHQDAGLAMPALIAALAADADDGVRANAVESLRARARGRDFGTSAAAWQTWWAGYGSR